MAGITAAFVSAGKIECTELSTTANITTSKIGCTGNITTNALYVQGDLGLIQGSLGVSGTISAGGLVIINTVQAGVLGVTGNANVYGTLGVTGAATFRNTLDVVGAVQAASLGVTGNAVVAGLVTTGSLGATGSVQAASLGVTGNAVVAGLVTTGSLGATGSVQAASLGVTGNAVVAGLVTTGSLGATGSVQAASLGVTGNAVVAGLVTTGSLGATGSVQAASLGVTGNAVVAGLVTTGSLGATGSVQAASLGVTGNAVVAGLVTTGSLGATGSVKAASLGVTGNAVVAGLVTTGSLGATGSVQAASLGVTGNAVVAGLVTTGSLGATGSVQAASIGITGNAHVYGTLGVTGTATFHGLVLGNSGVAVNALVDYTPISVKDSYAKDYLALLAVIGANTVPAGQTGIGDIIYNGGYVFGNAFTGEEQLQFSGQARYGSAAQISAEDYWNFASMGKLLGGLVAAKALEEEIVNIDDPVYKYLGDTGSAYPAGLTGNGWWAKENIKVLSWNNHGGTGGADYLGDVAEYASTFAPPYPTGTTGTWDLVDCQYDPTLRHCLQMAVGLPYDFADVGANFGSNYVYNPKLNRINFRRGQYLLGFTGAYRHNTMDAGKLLDPEYKGSTGYIYSASNPTIARQPLLDYGYKTSRNSLYEYTQGVTGGTVLTNQPGTVCEYGNGIDLFGIVLNKAIQQKNDLGYTGITRAGSTAYPYLDQLLAGNNAIWKRDVMLGSTGIVTYALTIKGAYDALGDIVARALYNSLTVQNVIEFTSDRITEPIGATSLFWGAGQQAWPADFTGVHTNDVGVSQLGYTGFTGPNIYGTFDGLGTPVLEWSHTGQASSLYVDGGYIYGNTLAGFAAAAYGVGTTGQGKIVEQYTSTISRLEKLNTGLKTQYVPELEYLGFFGATLQGKLKDYAKLLKLLIYKGVWNGSTVLGKQAAEFIVNASVPDTYDIQSLDPQFSNTLDPLNNYTPVGAVYPWAVYMDGTWGYGMMPFDYQNTSRRGTTGFTRMLPFPGKQRQVAWSGAYGTLWIVDLDTGMYLAGGTQQFSISDNSVGSKSRTILATGLKVSQTPAPNTGLLQMTLLNSISTYKPLKGT